MTQYSLRPTTVDDEMEVSSYLSMRWGSATVVAHGFVYHPGSLPGFVAIENDDWVGLVTYHIDGKACEIVTLNSDNSGRGVGTALIEAVKQAARTAGCNRLWLITTNDNWPAFRFYQKRGFHLAAVHTMAVEKSRKIKPIPQFGVDNIPIRDEIEFQMGIFKGR